MIGAIPAMMAARDKICSVVVVVDDVDDNVLSARSGQFLGAY
jgi:hypothetical protein